MQGVGGAGEYIVGRAGGGGVVPAAIHMRAGRDICKWKFCRTPSVSHVEHVLPFREKEVVKCFRPEQLILLYSRCFFYKRMHTDCPFYREMANGVD